MLGFDLDFWDFARKHPDAEAVRLMGWAGLLPTVLPWIQAFIWAFKPTDIVDIRRFPKEEARAVDEDIARLEANPRKYGRHAEAADPATRGDAPPPANGAPKA